MTDLLAPPSQEWRFEKNGVTLRKVGELWLTRIDGSPEWRMQEPEVGELLRRAAERMIPGRVK